MQHWNETGFFLVNGGLAHPLLDPLFLALSWLGAWPVALLAIAVLAWPDWRGFLRRHALPLGVGLVLVTGSTVGAKSYFDVDRPIRHFAQAIRAGTAEVRHPGPGGAPRKESFPSGHSSLSFFFLGYLALARRRLAFPALALASLIALSRVYVGAHFPFDCIAGAVEGSAFAGGAWLVVKRASPDVMLS